LEMAGLAAGSNVDIWRQQLEAFPENRLAIADPEAGARLLEAVPALRSRCAGFGADAVCAVARLEADVVLNGLTGYAGLRPSLAALDAGRHLALANKESMVVAAHLMRAAARR